MVLGNPLLQVLETTSQSLLTKLQMAGMKRSEDIPTPKDSMARISNFLKRLDTSLKLYGRTANLSDTVLPTIRNVRRREPTQDTSQPATHHQEITIICIGRT